MSPSPDSPHRGIYLLVMFTKLRLSLPIIGHLLERALSPLDDSLLTLSLHGAGQEDPMGYSLYWRISKTLNSVDSICDDESTA